MSLRKLAARLEKVEQLPVEIEEVRDALVALNIQDEIIFSPEDIDPKMLRGFLYRYTKRPGVYAAPELVSLVVYSSQLPIEWQRVVCSKELVHILDSPGESAKTPEQVQEFLDKLLGPISTEDYGLADLMAANDRLAVYQALPLLFPRAARERVMARRKREEVTINQIAEWAMLPVEFMDLVLGDEWPTICEILLDGGNSPPSKTG
jgi:hypothetical protein